MSEGDHWNVTVALVSALPGTGKTRTAGPAATETFTLASAEISIVPVSGMVAVSLSFFTEAERLESVKAAKPLLRLTVFVPMSKAALSESVTESALKVVGLPLSVS